MLTLLMAAFALATNAQTTAKEELDRIWTAYQTKLTESLKPAMEVYLKDLERIERDAMRGNDTIVAAAISKERSSTDLGLAPLDLPDKKTSSQITELRKVRADLDRKREDATKALNTWCRGELELVGRAFMQRKDRVSAAEVRVEYEAVSKPPVQIITATYGGADKLDVTLPMRKAIRFNHLEIAGGNKIAGDPAPYKHKDGSVTFKVGSSGEKTIKFGDVEKIRIPDK